MCVCVCVMNDGLAYNFFFFGKLSLSGLILLSLFYLCKIFLIYLSYLY
jgi:hypothetical protein